MLLPCSIAASNALIDFGRPTNSGITMWGKTTTSRKGNNGNWVCSVKLDVVMASLIKKPVNDVGARGENTSPSINKNHFLWQKSKKIATHEVAPGWLSCCSQNGTEILFLPRFCN
jgi:hypothetical protein